MPEGDTIFRAAAALHRALAGDVVTHFEAALAPLARVHDNTPITGRTVERGESIGKHLLIWFSGGLALRTHMRMSGSWHLYRHGERWQRPVSAMRVRIDTAAWVAVAFNVQAAEFLHERDLPRTRALSTLGPDLLSASFSEGDALARLAAAGSRPVGDVLLDQRVIAGIGNVFKSEVLFLCGIHPDQPVSTLTPAQLKQIIDIAVPLMRANTGATAESGIVTYRGLRRTTGRGSEDERLWVYGRSGKPCRKCGTPISWGRRGEGARSTYWCGRCQHH